MSFDLIEEQDKKYPPENFTRESVIKYNITTIVDKIRNVIINAKNLITSLEERIDIIETGKTSIDSRIDALEERILTLEGS